jgi:DNA-binding CsgD family transcriptional regulator
MIFFIVGGFSRPCRFLGIRRIAYECSCPTLRFSVKKTDRKVSMSRPDQCSLEALASLALTPREAEVLFWVSQGKSNHDIGIILGAKTGTICKHVEHILGKLNVENRTAAAVIALGRYSSAEGAPESKPIQAWTAIATLIMAQLSNAWANTWEICGEMTCLIA